MLRIIKLVVVGLVWIMVANAWCQEKAPEKEAKKPAEVTTVAPQTKSILAEIQACIKMLGDESFKVRGRATKRLLEIAFDSKTNHKKGELTNEEHVRREMFRLLWDDDPEVSHRAKKVLEKLKPFGEVGLDRFDLLRYAVDQKNDTIISLVKSYGIKPDWIKGANPGLKTDKDLQSLKTIILPKLKKLLPTDVIGHNHHHDEGMVIEIE